MTDPRPLVERLKAYIVVIERQCGLVTAEVPLLREAIAALETPQATTSDFANWSHIEREAQAAGIGYDKGSNGYEMALYAVRRLAELKVETPAAPEPETSQEGPMSVMTPVAQDSLLMIAWDAYKVTDAYTNARKWALHAEYVDGSLWTAFEAGFRSAPEPETGWQPMTDAGASR